MGTIAKWKKKVVGGGKGRKGAGSNEPARRAKRTRFTGGRKYWVQKEYQHPRREGADMRAEREYEDKRQALNLSGDREVEYSQKKTQKKKKKKNKGGEKTFCERRRAGQNKEGKG